MAKRGQRGSVEKPQGGEREKPANRGKLKSDNVSKGQRPKGVNRGVKRKRGVRRGKRGSGQREERPRKVEKSEDVGQKIDGDSKRKEGGQGPKDGERKKAGQKKGCISMGRKVGKIRNERMNGDEMSGGSKATKESKITKGRN